ncbi:hypothetical protein [Nannocystis pusilla]|uniref:hypothetical protein n=1 Tax=Nannocystis pusilla TaxID=889268 RepID=UPI003B7A845E
MPARDCTYGKVPGGKRHECAKCLERFQLSSKQPLLAANAGDASYHCTAPASRWPELFGAPLAVDSEVGRSEYPCSWLRAVMRYAGGGERADARLFKTAREIVAVGKAAAATTTGGAPEAGDEEAEAEAPPDAGTTGKKGKKSKAPKKPKKKSAPLLAMEAAFARVRKQLKNESAAGGGLGLVDAVDPDVAAGLLPAIDADGAEEPAVAVFEVEVEVELALVDVSHGDRRAGLVGGSAICTSCRHSVRHSNSRSGRPSRSRSGRRTPTRPRPAGSGSGPRRPQASCGRATSSPPGSVSVSITVIQPRSVRCRTYQP